jgi:hypothetical protein
VVMNIAVPEGAVANNTIVLNNDYYFKVATE